MVRDTTDGKSSFLNVLFGPMLQRWAAHTTKGREKYADPAPGLPNWTLATGAEEYLRFKDSAFRHMIQWLRGDRDEDHASAVFFNINGAEYLLEKCPELSPTLGAIPYELGPPAEKLCLDCELPSCEGAACDPEPAVKGDPWKGTLGFNSQPSAPMQAKLAATFAPKTGTQSSTSQRFIPWTPGAAVVVNAPSSQYHGRSGTVVYGSSGFDWAKVQLAGDAMGMYFQSGELLRTAVVPKDEPCDCLDDVPLKRGDRVLILESGSAFEGEHGTVHGIDRVARGFHYDLTVAPDSYSGAIPFHRKDVRRVG